jgi:hypothetical protein
MMIRFVVITFAAVCLIAVGGFLLKGNATNDKSGRITIVNNEFRVDGKRIWINGANTPWNKWNDFGGTGWMAYDNAWWDNEFARLHAAGINATRIWINCDNGNNAINIDTNGNVSGADSKHWQDVDRLFELAEKHKIYIMATLLSFDHFKDGNSQGERWTSMVKNQANVRSFADNYTKPFVIRYKDNPYLWSIDLCNEPEWASVDENGANKPKNPLTWAELQYFFAYNASVIHANSEVLVTVGLAIVKYNADGGNYNGNKISDALLKAQYNTGNPCLDFWSPHTYEWVGEWYGVAHYLTPGGARGGNSSGGYYGGYGLDRSKPAVIGECSAKGTTTKERGWIRSQERPSESNSIITDYENAYINGWQGVMAWTSNGVDGNGDLSSLSPATNYMFEKYQAVIFPSGY